MEETYECSICLEDNDELVRISCGHRFHASCLEQCFAAKYFKCAMCRNKIALGIVMEISPDQVGAVHKRSKRGMAEPPLIELLEQLRFCSATETLQKVKLRHDGSLYRRVFQSIKLLLATDPTAVTSKSSSGLYAIELAIAIELIEQFTRVAASEPKITKLLLKYKPDSNPLSSPNNPLYSLIKSDNLELVKLLVTRGKIDLSQNQSFTTSPLQIVRSEMMFRWLIEHGCDVNYRRAAEGTLLLFKCIHMAVFTKSDDQRPNALPLDLLLSLPAGVLDVNAANGSGDNIGTALSRLIFVAFPTPMHFFHLNAARRALDVMCRLLNAGADPNLPKQWPNQQPLRSIRIFLQHCRSVYKYLRVEQHDLFDDALKIAYRVEGILIVHGAKEKVEEGEEEEGEEEGEGGEEVVEVVEAF